MSFVIATPEFIASGAPDLATIGSTVGAANAAAAARTTELVAAGADEVSTSVAALFGAHAQAFQTLSAEAAAFHQQFVRLINAGVASYAASEAANASPLQTLEQDLLGAINAPTQTLVGRPLIGNGADGGPGQNGGPGGILIGNGGNGGGRLPRRLFAGARGESGGGGGGGRRGG